jgi:hypothetical protein
MIQREPAGFDLLLVPRTACDPDGLGDRVGRELSGLLGCAVTLRVSLVEDLPRTSGGKVRPVVTPLARS